MFGVTNAVDPQMGRNVEDTISILQSIDWLSDADRSKLTEGNARKVSSRMKVGASG
jgi:4-oxalmesaconate hydratase